MSETQKTRIDITWWSIVRILAILFGFYLLFLIRDIIAILFMVFIFVAALNPIVSKMQKKGLPRIAAVTLVFIAIMLILGVSSTLMFQPLVNQINDLAKAIPDHVGKAVPAIENFLQGTDFFGAISTGLQQFSGSITSFSTNVVTTTLGVLGSLFTAFTIMVLTFYLLLEEKALKDFVDNVIPPKYKDELVRVLNQISSKMGSWVRGQLLLMIIIGILYYIGLVILKVESPLALAVWGGLTEVVPFIGPILGGVPAILVALLTGSPLQAALVVVIMIVIQQVEGQFLVPKVMQKAVGLSPVIVIVALLIGGKLLGVIGALLAIPIAAIVAVLVKQWPQIEKTLNS